MKTFSFPRLVLISAVLGAVSFTSGCGTWVKVNSLAQPGADAISYELRNANHPPENDTVRYKRGADYVRTALSGRGMFEAPPGVKPDVIVSVEFGMGPPQSRRVTRSEPIYRDIPSRIPVSVDNNNNFIYANGIAEGVEVSGYRERVDTVFVYEKYLRLVARRASPGADGVAHEVIWSVDVTTESEKPDLRKQLPLLVGASIEYIGKDSHGEVKIRIKHDDADVLFVKQGMLTAEASKK